MSNAIAPARVKDIYSDIISSKALISVSNFPMVLWKSSCPPRMIFFAWLVFNNKNLSGTTWGRDAGMVLAGVRCANQLRRPIYTCFFNAPRHRESGMILPFFLVFLMLSLFVHAAFQWWCSQSESRRPLLVIMIWGAWKWQNFKIFRDSKVPYKSILPRISSIFYSVPRK